ncbi:hypothetical protein F4677DRAFT_458940 [Hypoxylon crocopeplum]|nr:hypothetical protein F4677DRAFT_458940 [Hypoxylon crocopeplum]
MSEAQREAKAEAAENCSWRGDSPEPELDDFTHDESRQPPLPDEVCSWQGDSPDPELDDLAHDPGHKDSPELSPKSRATSSVKPRLSEIEPKPLETTKDKEPESPEGPKKDSTVPVEPDNRGHTHDIPPDKPSDEETLQDRVAYGVQQALNIFQNIIKPSSSQPASDEPSADRKPSGKENNVPIESPPPPPVPTIAVPEAPKGKKTKEDREKAKKEKAEAKKAEKEKKAKEKEDKKKLKQQLKEDRRKEKDKKKKMKGKEPAEPPPDLPTGAGDSAAAEPLAVESLAPNPHPECKLCQDPEDEKAAEFMKESAEAWQGLPSFNDLTTAAKKWLGMKDTEGKEVPQGTEGEAAKCSSSMNEAELIEHIIKHINKHIHQHHMDPESSGGGGGNQPSDKAPPSKFGSFPAHGEGPDTAAKQQGGGDGDATGHGLDGNGDWPVSMMRGPMLRSPEPALAPDFFTTQPPSPGYSPFRAPASRCVSPWCEHLGLKMDDSPLSFPKRPASWSRRGFNSSPSRMRSAAPTPCVHAPIICPHTCYHEPALYACVPVSLVPALCLESPCCGHYASPIRTPSSIPHSPRPAYVFEPVGIAETVASDTVASLTPRRSLSAN